MHDSSATPLVIGCHHKTGSNLLLQVINQLFPRLIQKGRLKNVASGNPIDRKLPLSAILTHFRGCGCYVNQWFEHEVDVPPDSIRFAHFVRHPAKWVRSAYLYHKKGAPADLIRWLDWKVFAMKGEVLSYCEALNRLNAGQGLAIEAVRSFPEILGTAPAARTSASLAFLQQFSLEQAQDRFEETISRLCTFIGFSEPEASELLPELRHLDLSHSRPGSLPPNVTNTSPQSAELERTLNEDPLFSRLFAGAAKDMGFPLAEGLSGGRSSLSGLLVEALLNGSSQFTTPWQAAERKDGFMRQQNSNAWWSAHILQVPGCGHLMMHGFIQQMLDGFE